MEHRKTVRHYHEPGDFHEITFSCYQRKPLLTNDDWRRRLAVHLDNANREAHMALIAFVFMPNHVHLLVLPDDHRPDIGRYLARIKQPFSLEIKELLACSHSRLLDDLTVKERPGKTCFRFWQEGGGYDRNLRNPPAIAASLHYIHNNPVRGGLSEDSLCWRWSSARFYLADPAGKQYPDLPYIHGLPEDFSVDVSLVR